MASKRGRMLIDLERLPPVNILDSFGHLVMQDYVTN